MDQNLEPCRKQFKEHESTIYITNHSDAAETTAKTRFTLIRKTVNAVRSHIANYLDNEGEPGKLEEVRTADSETLSLRDTTEEAVESEKHTHGPHAVIPSEGTQSSPQTPSPPTMILRESRDSATSAQSLAAQGTLLNLGRNDEKKRSSHSLSLITREERSQLLIPISATNLSAEEEAIAAHVLRSKLVDAANSEPIHAVTLLADTSTSMNVPPSKAGTPVDQLNAALKIFCREISSDPSLVDCLALSLVGFLDAPPHYQILRDFSHPRNVQPPTITADTGTPLCQCIAALIPRVQAVRRILARGGREQRKAWIMVLSDGAPTDPQYENLAREAILQANEVDICVYFFGVGQCDLSFMKRISQPGRPPVMMPREGWPKFMAWIHRSVSRASASQGRQIWSQDMPFGDGEIRMEV